MNRVGAGKGSQTPFLLAIFAIFCMRKAQRWQGDCRFVMDTSTQVMCVARMMPTQKRRARRAGEAPVLRKFRWCQADSLAVFGGSLPNSIRASMTVHACPVVDKSSSSESLRGIALAIAADSPAFPTFRFQFWQARDDIT
jgi:hypothetical protein